MIKLIVLMFLSGCGILPALGAYSNATGAINTVGDTQRLMSDISPDEFTNWPDCSVVSGGKYPRIAKNPAPKKMLKKYLPLDGNVYAAYGRWFLVRSHNPKTAMEVCKTAERQYFEIITRLDLRGSGKQRLYPITVYSDMEEYSGKTAQSRRSGGTTVGNAIYIYESQDSPKPILAHEITHVILNETFGQAEFYFKWFDEGLASVMALEAMPKWERMWEERRLLEAARSAAPTGGMVFPRDPEDEDCGLWYAQAASLVWYMYNAGGSVRMAGFLNILRGGAPVFVAYHYAYSDVWNYISEMEKDWKAQAETKTENISMLPE